MKLKTLILIMAIFCLIWGAGFILLPLFFWSLYGLTLDVDGVYMSRQLGVVFFMLGMILWLARKVQDPVALRAIAAGLFIGNTIGLGAMLITHFSAGTRML